jgi:hypothetical protein
VFERLYHQAMVLRHKLQSKKERIEMEEVRLFGERLEGQGEPPSRGLKLPRAEATS